MSPSLHTINTPPSDHETLSQCLSALSSQDVLLLIEDAVYLALPAHVHKLSTQGRIYALSADVEARGIETNPLIPIVSDEDFVDLTLQCDRVISWF